MRVHHYLKNLIIFTPLIFISNYQIDQIIILVESFICFSLTSSIIYIYNDIKDLKIDRENIENSKRPLASGVISILHAKYLISILTFSQIFLLILINNNVLLLFISLYLLINLFYTNFLKYLFFVDVVTLSVFFLIRIYLGFKLVGVEITYWFLIYAFLFFILISLLKRLSNISVNEHIKSIYKSEKIIKNLIFILMGLSILNLLIFLQTDQLLLMFKNKIYYLTLISLLIFFKIRWIIKITRETIPRDPVVFIYKDKVNILIIIISIFVLSLSLR